MMKIFVILIITSVTISKCVVREDLSHVLHGLFSDSDETHVYYGSLDLDASQFNIFSSLSINDVGNPKNIKYPVLPLTYNPNNGVVYMAAPNSQNKTILSVINATNGKLITTFTSVSNPIISLQYDIFQKQLFAHIETDHENVTLIGEIDTNNGSVKQILGTINDIKPTHMSSYCPICRKYFLIMMEDQQFVYVGVNTSNLGGIDWKVVISFTPISIRFDYKTFTMYTTYLNQTDDIISSIGILNRTIGGISQVVGIISDDSSIVATTHSAYDIAEKIYYTSIHSTWPFPTEGVSYVNTNTSEERWVLFP